MTVDVIVVGILAILLLGLAIYLWIDRKGWIEMARDAARTCGAIKEAYKDLDSLAKALDDENAELTVKCNQYEALLQQRLDDIPVADLGKCNQGKCDSGECCKTCVSDDCPDRVRNFYPEQPKVKPCCSCENGVYDPTECIGCTEANGYENYEPMKYE